MPIQNLPASLRQDVQTFFLSLPDVGQAAVRDTYLRAPLPELAAVLPGSSGAAVTDVLAVTNTLDALGTISEGRWPLLVLISFAAMILPEGARRHDAVTLRRRVEAFYASVTSPSPIADGDGLEAIVGTDQRLQFAFFEGAVATARAVGLLIIRTDEGDVSGTCWLLTERHVITNWHVVALLQQGRTAQTLAENARRATVRFDYTSLSAAGEYVDDLHWTAGDESLDYAVLELPSPQKRVPLTVQLSPRVKGVRLNVVQHPQGGPLSFAVRENDSMGSPSPEVVRYLSDTEPGSSGSPVCDDAWNVVALHRAARPTKTVVGSKTYSIHNEGVLMRPILDSLPSPLRQSVATVG